METKSTLEAASKPKMRVIKGADDRRNQRLNEIKVWLAQKKHMSRLTHDVPTLNKAFYHDIFVYGSLKQDFRGHKMIHSQAQALGTGWTTTRTLRMYENKKGGYPVVLPDTLHGVHVYGQIYRVPAENIMELDRFEQNGIMFQRQRRYVYMIDKLTRKHFRCSCWMYIGIPSCWNKHIKEQTEADPWLIPNPVFKRKEDPLYEYQVWTKVQDAFYEKEQAF